MSIDELGIDFVGLEIVDEGNSDLKAKRPHDLVGENHVLADEDLAQQAAFLLLDLEGLVKLLLRQRGVLEQDLAELGFCFDAIDAVSVHSSLIRCLHPLWLVQERAGRRSVP